MSINTYNVIFIKWGDYYHHSDINKICSQIKRNTKHNINFYCFTENSDGLDNFINIRPLPELDVNPEFIKFNYRKAAGLCDDNLGGLNGQRVFFFDIDCLIVGNLDEFFEYDYGNDFYIINDWAHRKGKKKDKVGQASCYTHIVGTLGHVKKYFEENPAKIIEKYSTATQQYMSAKIIEKYGKLNFFPDNWFKSFRFHCMPHPALRWLLNARLPKVNGLKMIAFHGVPSISEALEGRYGQKEKGNKVSRWLKKIYKRVKPTLWINNYWK